MMFDPLKKTYRSVREYFGLVDEQNISYRRASSDMSDYHYPSFSQNLPYEYFDEKAKIFYNKYNSGIIYRITPLTGANEAVAEQLDGILRSKVSDHFTLQVLLVKHNKVAAQIERFARQFEQESLPELSKIGQSLEAYYKKAAQSGFKTLDETRAQLAQTEVYIIVDQDNQKRTEDEIRFVFDQFRVDFEASLTASSIGYVKCDALDFLYLSEFFLKHDTQDIYPREVSYREEELLKYQLTDQSFELKVDELAKDHLKLYGDNEQTQAFETDISVLSVDKLPSEFHIWDNINASSNIFNKEYAINCNHIISVIYKLDPHAKAVAKAARKRRDLDKKAKGEYGKVVAGTEEAAIQWKGFHEDLAKHKTCSCKMLYNVILFSKPEQRATDVAKAINAFGFIGLKLSVIKRMQLPYFLVSMPFMFTANLQYDFALPTMMKPISSWNAIQYMPILSDWQGQQEGILLPSMRGQFAMINQFSGAFGTNYNCAVTGVSGSGKSALMQMMILNVLFEGGYAYLIDIGGSYKKLCEALGGVYLQYSNLAMNPFTHVSDIKKSISSIVRLFEVLTNGESGSDVKDRAALREAILKAFDKKGNETLVDDVKQALLDIYDPDSYPTANILAVTLDKFTSTSENGRVFNESSKLDPSARLIVVDLQDIAENEDVISPVLMSIFSQYSSRIYNSPRNVKKICLIDEAWQFFLHGDPRAIGFLERGFRTGRRFNCSFIVVTQGIGDYFATPAATPLWENAAIKFVLLQDDENFNKFNNEHEVFSAYEMEVLKNFPAAAQAGYSQVQIRGKGLRAFQRLFVDPFTLVLISSKGEDYQAVEQLKAQGVPLLEAVDQVAKAHYGGMYQ